VQALKQIVSVIIPVYNGANYLAEAIDSALAQSWPHCEVIVVDDGSNDGGATERIAQSYGDRIRYVHKRNGGVGSALNCGIQEMRGEYFSWLSHDDVYLPTKVEVELRAARAFIQPCLVLSDFARFFTGGKIPELHSIANGNEFAEKPLWAILEGKIHGCTMLVPREAFENCGRFDESRPTTQDYELWFRMALKYPFIHVPEVLVQSRQHEQQGSRAAQHLEEASLLWLEMLQRIPPATMIAYEGSELAFLRRVQRFLAKSPYATAAERVATLLPALKDRDVNDSRPKPRSWQLRGLHRRALAWLTGSP
jgi:glycosyltransferase involved in cell wall biosynthesis